MLCAVGVSTWVVSPSVPSGPTWAEGQAPVTNVYVNRIIEVDYDADGFICTADNLSEKLILLNEDGETVTDVTANVVFERVGGAYKYQATNGDISIALDGIINVGSTYKVPCRISLSDETKYNFAGTYESIENGELVGTKELTSDGLLLKYKTVQIGNTWYTIEDALNANGNVTVKADTSFTSTDIASLAGYNINSYYTVKSGVNLLLPFIEGDTQGYLSAGDKPENITSPAAYPENYSGSKTVYATLKIPGNISLINNGTITVGALTSAIATGATQGAISGGYSVIDLVGTIYSTGKLIVYGQISGSGNINATGGSVRERFEITDWRGGTVAAPVFMGTDKVPTVGTIQKSKDQGNQFPFKCYKLQAITAKLTVSNAVTYSGIARIYTSAQSLGSMEAVSARITEADYEISASSSSENGLIKLTTSRSSLTKTIKNGRTEIKVSGGAVAGQTIMEIKVATITAKISTGAVAFPITGTIDLILENGEYTSDYGYKILPGATFTVQNNATLTLTNSVKGTIVYKESDIDYKGSNEKYPSGRADGKFIVGNNATVNINGSFGGEILGIKEAINSKLVISSSATLNVYTEEGTGTLKNNYINVELTYTATSKITEYANGELYGGSDNFTAGKTYEYTKDGDRGYWAAEQTYTIKYNLNANNDSSAQFIGASSFTGTGLQGKAITIAMSDLTTSAERKYYTFEGWYHDPACTRQVTYTDPIRFVLGEITEYTIYAKWEPITYYITYQSVFVPEGVGASVNYDSIKNSLLTSFNVVSRDLNFNTDDIKEAIESISPAGFKFDGFYVDGLVIDNVLQGNDLVKLLNGGDTVTIHVQWRDISSIKFTIYYGVDKETEFSDELKEQIKNGLDNVGELTKTVEVHVKRNLNDDGQYDYIYDYELWYPIDIGKNDNLAYSHDFNGWLIEDKDNITSFVDLVNKYKTTTENDIIVYLTASWTAKPITVIFSDTVMNFSITEYYHNGKEDVVNGSPDRLNEAYGYDSGNDNKSIPTYLNGWIDKENIAGFGPDENWEWSLDKSLIEDYIFEAERPNKLAITFKDPEYNYENGNFVPFASENGVTYFFKPDTKFTIGVIISDYDSTAGDYNLNVPTYYNNGWKNDDPEDTKIYQPGDIYTVKNVAPSKEEVTTITFTAERAKKARITIKLSNAYLASVLYCVVAAYGSTDITDSVNGGSSDKDVVVYVKEGQNCTIETRRGSNNDKYVYTVTDIKNGYGYRGSASIVYNRLSPKVTNLTSLSEDGIW